MGRHRRGRRPSEGLGSRTPTKPSAPLQIPTRETSSAQNGPRANPIPRVFVIGAGTELSLGMPTMQTLLPDLATYARTEGQPVADALRKRLRWLSFSFDKFAGEQRDNVVFRLFEGEQALADNLQSIGKKLPPTPTMAAFNTLLTHVATMGASNLIAGEELDALRAALDGEDLGQSLTVLEAAKLPLADAPRLIMVKAIREAQTSGVNFSEPEREALADLLLATANIEEVLATYFTLFVAGRRADRSRYLYLVWTLWAYLRSRTASVIDVKHSLYPKLPQLADFVITFNYTPFLARTNLRSDQCNYFHGRLDRRLEIGSRRLSAVPADILATTDEDKVAKFVSTLALDVGEYPALDIPALVPPLLLKPVMTRRQILDWAEADRALQSAYRVVIAGYSFAAADEHFNDLLRNCNPYSRITVVNPDQGPPLKSVCRVLGIDPDTLVPKAVAGRKALVAGRLVYVVATAEEISPDVLNAADSITTD